MKNSTIISETPNMKTLKRMKKNMIIEVKQLMKKYDLKSELIVNDTEDNMKEINDVLVRYYEYTEARADFMISQKNIKQD